MAVASNKWHKIIESQLRRKFIVFSFEVCGIDIDWLEPQRIITTTELDRVLFLTQKISLLSHCIRIASVPERNARYGRELCHLQST